MLRRLGAGERAEGADLADAANAEQIVRVLHETYRTLADAANAEQIVRALHETYRTVLISDVARLTGDRVAADVVQETSVPAWQNAEKLAKGEGSVRSWLPTTARNIVRDQARARDARPPEIAITSIAEDAR